MIPQRLRPWLRTQPLRFQIAFRLRYALFSIPQIGPRLASRWIDR
jgi:hypothetical protein